MAIKLYCIVKRQDTERRQNNTEAAAAAAATTTTTTKTKEDYLYSKSILCALAQIRGLCGGACSEVVLA